MLLFVYLDENHQFIQWRSDIVCLYMQEGFKYHHAEESYVMLTYWIPEGPCMLPANASHQVGVGGFIINEKDEVCLCLLSVIHCGVHCSIMITFFALCT